MLLQIYRHYYTFTSSSFHARCQRCWREQKPSPKPIYCYPSKLPVVRTDRRLKKRGLTGRHEQPKWVHEEKIPPEIIRFRSIITLSKGKIFKQAGRKIDEVSIKLACWYQSLKGMAKRWFFYDQHSRQPWQWTPCKLFLVSWVDLIRNKSSHHSQAFHA